MHRWNKSEDQDIQREQIIDNHSTEGLMISWMIDGMEGWNVATADIRVDSCKLIMKKETYISIWKGECWLYYRR